MSNEALKFYIDYKNEMEELYGNKNVEIIPKEILTDEVVEDIEKVGHEACSEALEILMKFSECLIGSLKDKVGIRKTTQPNIIRRDWNVGHVYWDKDKDEGKDWLNMIGAMIHINSGEFVIWAWKHGGEESENYLIEQFSKHFEDPQRSGPYDFKKGNIVLNKINIDLFIDSYAKNKDFISHLDFFKEIKLLKKDDWRKILKN